MGRPPLCKGPSARRLQRARGNLSLPACSVLAGGPVTQPAEGVAMRLLAPARALWARAADGAPRSAAASPGAPLAPSNPGSTGTAAARVPASGLLGKVRGLVQKSLPSDIKKKDGRRAEPAQTRAVLQNTTPSSCQTPSRKPWHQDGELKNLHLCLRTRVSVRFSSLEGARSPTDDAERPCGHRGWGRGAGASLQPVRALRPQQVFQDLLF